jgi:transcriptional regulator GlxA family with amidase domain
MNTDLAQSSGQNTPRHFGFLIVPHFPLVPYASAIETLRIANGLQGKNLYTWESITLRGEPVSASCGLEVMPKNSMANATSFSTLFVCGGIRIREAWSTELGVWLRTLAKKGIALGALSNGSYLLAKAGLLDGYRCAIHWDRLATTREEFPDLSFSNSIYELDRYRYTCAGGVAAIDMMLELISLEHGRKLAQAISDQLVVDRMRCTLDQQRIPLHHEIGTSQPKLTEAAILMSTNLEEPLNTEELAGYVGISRRQLERLFRHHLNCTPTRYYVGLRLKAARRLLTQTEKSITEISIFCGFSSIGHFSKCYRDEFGLPPRSDRIRLLAADQSGAILPSLS